MTYFPALYLSCFAVVVLADPVDKPTFEKPQCEVILDLMFLQDTTQSYEDDFPVLLPQLDALFESFYINYPTSYIGIAEFKDKPLLPFGWKEDYCYKLKSPLTSNTAQVHNAFADLYASGGDDLLEDQYAALITTAEDPSIGWHSLTLSDDETKRSVKKGRLIIMSTDASPHYDGDHHSPELPKRFVPHDGHLTDVYDDCNMKRYPVYSQVADALKAQNIKLGSMTPDEDPEVTGTWTWFNEMILSQTTEYNQVLASDSSNFASSVSNIINLFSKELCTGVSQPSGGLQSSQKDLPVVFNNVSSADGSGFHSAENVSDKRVYLNVRGKGKHAMDIDLNAKKGKSGKSGESDSGVSIKNIDNDE